MKIVTFGEIMLRLTPPDYHIIENANSFHANYGGGEANVAVSLSRFGHSTSFVSVLPNNKLADGAIRHLTSYKVNTDYIVRKGDNIGIYFLESGFGGRGSRVIYNRKHSSISEVRVDDFDYDLIFKDAKWFHVSGITLALGDNVRKVLLKLLEKAKEYNVTISFDCNYRKKLWSLEDAVKEFKKVLPYVDILFASSFDSEYIFGNKRNLKLDLEAQEDDLFKQLIDNSNVKMIFGTKRSVYTATDNELIAYCYLSNKKITTEPIRFNIHDRIGGGDAFAAGIINKLIKEPNDLEKVLEFGLATSILKHTIWGDAFMLSEAEVNSYIDNKKGNINR